MSAFIGPSRAQPRELAPPLDAGLAGSLGPQANLAAAPDLRALFGAALGAPLAIQPGGACPGATFRDLARALASLDGRPPRRCALAALRQLPRTLPTLGELPRPLGLAPLRSFPGLARLSPLDRLPCPLRLPALGNLARMAPLGRRLALAIGCRGARARALPVGSIVAPFRPLRLLNPALGTLARLGASICAGALPLSVGLAALLPGLAALLRRPALVLSVGARFAAISAVTAVAAVGKGRTGHRRGEQQGDHRAFHRTLHFHLGGEYGPATLSSP